MVVDLMALVIISIALTASTLALGADLVTGSIAWSLIDTILIVVNGINLVQIWARLKKNSKKGD